MASSFWTGGPHPTSGLAGYPARDYGAPGGTPVYAWTSLKVRRLSGQSGYRGGGIGGINVYLQDRAGKEYFMTHVENVQVKVGAVVQPGQRIAEVGNYGTPHVHLGYTGGDPSTTLSIRPEYLFTPGGAVAGSKVVDSATGRITQPLTPEQKKQVGVGIIRGDIKPGDLPPGSTVQTGGPLADEARSVLGGITSVADAIKWFGGNWDRVAEVVGGFILLLVGLILLGRSMGVGGKRAGGDLLNRWQFGPEVTQGVRDPGLSRPQVVYTDEPSARPRRSSGYNPETADIPF